MRLKWPTLAGRREDVDNDDGGGGADYYWGSSKEATFAGLQLQTLNCNFDDTECAAAAVDDAKFSDALQHLA